MFHTCIGGNFLEHLHEGHRQRMKERFINSGGANFQEHEILEMLLYYSFPRIDTNSIAHTLINSFGSLSAVLDADISELIKIKGISYNTAVLIKLMPKISELYLMEEHEKDILSTSAAVKKFFIHFFVGSKNEELRIAGLNEDLTVKAKKLLYEGSINSVTLNIRKIIEFSYSNNCDKIIIGHNHPNGIARPSKDDIIATEELKTSLRRVGITLLDHIITADGKAISMYDEGYFTTFDPAR